MVYMKQTKTAIIELIDHKVYIQSLIGTLTSSCKASLKPTDCRDIETIKSNYPLTHFVKTAGAISTVTCRRYKSIWSAAELISHTDVV